MDAKRTHQEPLSKTETENFVNFYIAQSCLWDVSHKTYSKRDVRQAALAMIAMQMQESCGRAMTVDQVSAKIASLRTYYWRELKKVDNSQKSGAASSDLYVSQWDFFQMLDPFLRSQVQKRPSVSNMIPAEKDLQESETESTPTLCTDADLPTKSFTEEIDNFTSPVPLAKKRKQGSEKEVDINTLMIKTLTQISERKKDNTDCDCDILFGKQVGLEIQKINSERKRQELKLKIQSLIFNYQFESEP